MLRVEILNEESDIIDFVLSKSVDSITASYIRMYTNADVIKTMDQQISNADGELFGIYEGNKLFGVVSYFWIVTEEYMQTTIFLIEGRYDEVAAFAIKHMKNGRENYKLFIGMPAENIEAIDFLSKAGKLSENSMNFILESYEAKYIQNDKVIKIECHNFPDFELFYEKYAIKYEMYWSSKNIFLEIDRFDIFAYVDQGEIIGCIFSKKGKTNQEIYGLFIDYEDSRIYKSLLSELLHCIKVNSESLRVTYFIDPVDSLELSNAEDLGFCLQDTYKGFEL